MSDSDHDRLYLEFTERLIETGDREIPASWPEDVRERCRFFLAGRIIALERSLRRRMKVMLDPEGGVRKILLS